MAILKITDHIDRALALLPDVTHDSPSVRNLLTALLAGHQELEDAAWDILTLRYLPTAMGVQLDHIGAVMNVAREGKSDTDYQLAISGVGAQLGRSGQIEVLLSTYIQLWSVLYSSVTGVILTEYYPGAVAVSVTLNGNKSEAVGTFTLCADADVDGNGDGPLNSPVGLGNGTLWDIPGPGTLAHLAAGMGNVKAQGVELTLAYQDIDYGTTGYAFLWGDSADADVNGDCPIANNGFGDVTDVTLGGIVSDVFSS